MQALTLITIHTHVYVPTERANELREQIEDPGSNMSQIPPTTRWDMLQGDIADVIRYELRSSELDCNYRIDMGVVVDHVTAVDLDPSTYDHDPTEPF